MKHRSFSPILKLNSAFTTKMNQTNFVGVAFSIKFPEFNIQQSEIKQIFLGLPLALNFESKTFSI